MRPHPRFSHRHRPPWWPENEEWPPKRWGYMRRNPFFRRMGCIFFAFNFFGLIIFGIVIGTIISTLSKGGYSGNVLGWLLPLAVIFVIFIIAISIFAARNIRRMSNPLDELVEASNKVAEGDYSIRVEEKGPPEVRFLLRGFNSMAERLQVTDQQRRNMLADVSHELRTPITVIQGNVEGNPGRLVSRGSRAFEVHFRGNTSPFALGGRLADSGAGRKRRVTFEARANQFA